MSSESYLIKNAQIISEGAPKSADIHIKDGIFQKIGAEIQLKEQHIEIDASNLICLPGLIDDQVHFREPGLTHKAEIYTEAKAAVAGGVTSYMEMPNVKPQTLTQSLLQDKYDIGAARSLANYSFYMGTSNDNLDEVLRTDPKEVCGLKIFMGSSTGNMLVDDEYVLENIFGSTPMLIATHCEDEQTVKKNLELAVKKFGNHIPFEEHPNIRSREACYISSSRAIALAKKKGARLHILHISTGEEVDLFDNDMPLEKKKITAEACIHHLYFSDEDYPEKQQWIKWNPAVKTEKDRKRIWEGLLSDKIDVIATDHAPHTIAEKENPYLLAPSGGPLVQHSLLALLDFYHEGKITLEQIANKASHAVAKCFRIERRGYIKEGYHADMVLADIDRPYEVSKKNVLSKCGWSPFEGHTFKSSINKTFVSGHLAYDNGKFDESVKGQRMTFNWD
ncbi:MAG: dihydroorotase [Cyclobacteriaceae bacterium]|nr:dihydroorotase [Cyclobacteriaceae bacterium HetDA_MAG_MS6]